jgi:hypothetical protein
VDHARDVSDRLQGMEERPGRPCGSELQAQDDVLWIIGVPVDPVPNHPAATSVHGIPVEHFLLASEVLGPVANQENRHGVSPFPSLG